MYHMCNKIGERYEERELATATKRKERRYDEIGIGRYDTQYTRGGAVKTRRGRKIYKTGE